MPVEKAFEPVLPTLRVRKSHWGDSDASMVSEGDHVIDMAGAFDSPEPEGPFEEPEPAGGTEGMARYEPPRTMCAEFPPPA